MTCRVRRKRPNLPVVIVTGYAEIGETKDLDGMLLLKKPYRLDNPAATIESALDSRQLLAVAASG